MGAGREEEERFMENQSKRNKDLVSFATELFSKGYNCCQACLAPFLGEMPSEEREHVMKMTSIMGGGMGRTGQTCGAITGSLMALGWTRGFSSGNDPDEKERLYQLAQQWMRLFSREYASTTCPGLTGFDLSDPKQRELANAAGVSELCKGIVQKWAQITQFVLNSPNPIE